MSVALVILYNWRYDENIEILEKIYRGRFSHIYHLVPLYRGDKPNVIPVYGPSYCFQGYLAQGLDRYFSEEYTHYFFIHDDLLLNPAINEENYQDYFSLREKSSFLAETANLSTLSYWPWLKRDNTWGWSPSPLICGPDLRKELPSYDEAMKIFKKPQFLKLNIRLDPLKYKQINYEAQYHIIPVRSILRSIRARDIRALIKLRHIFYRRSYQEIKQLFAILTQRRYPLAYPLLCGYSDIVIVAAQDIKRFCHYCGAFAAGDLFVEIALPTALVLSAEEIVTGEELQFKLKPRSLSDITSIKDFTQHRNQLRSLLAHFPPDVLYFHPVKFSQWNTEI